MRSIRLGLALLVMSFAAGAAPVVAAEPALVTGVFVGQVASRAFVAIVADDHGVLAYLCDGETTGTWFAGHGRNGNAIDLQSADGTESLIADLRSHAAVGWVTYHGQPLPFALQPARGNAGLYRSEGDVDGVAFLGGWIVLDNGKEIGVQNAGGVTLTSPLTGTGTTALTVVTPSTNPVLVLDLGRGAIDLGGQTVTTLVDPAVLQAVRWTKASNDDVFLAIDATAARSLGYEVFTPGGMRLDGIHLVRGGLRVRNLFTGTTTTTTSGFSMLRTLDRNGDGIISPADPVWNALRLYFDADSQGDVDAGEIAIFGSFVSFIAVAPISATAFKDAVGNVIQAGTFRSAVGTNSTTYGVSLKGL